MSTKTKTQQRGQARMQLPERHQMELRTKSLNQMVPRDHLARQVVSFVGWLDLSELYADIRATKDNVGRVPIDPRILFCLWLYATLEGETSGRRIAILTERDVIYEYLRGGVSVNYHTICDFRSQHRKLLKRILTDSVAILHHHGLVQPETIVQDGIRVRASAGSSSFRRQEKLEESRAAAQEYLEQLESCYDDEDADENNGGNDAPSHRQKSARERAAREKSQRLQDAREQLKELQKA